MDDRRKGRMRWAIALGSVIVPLAVVVLSLPYHGGLWLLLALAGGAAASVILVELGERRDAAGPEPDFLPASLRLREIQVPDAPGGTGRASADS